MRHVDMRSIYFEPIPSGGRVEPQIYLRDFLPVESAKGLSYNDISFGKVVPIVSKMSEVAGFEEC